MMKVSITGHTSGLGLAIYDKYINDGHTVKGFSRSNGYDITKKSDIDDIVILSETFDVLINNAYAEFAQINVLYAMHELWKNDSSKTILNISSMSADGIKNFRHPYAIHKNALDRAVEQLQNCNNTKCRIMNLKPGYIDTRMVAHIEHAKMTPNYVADIAIWMISQTDGFIRTLTVGVPKQ